MSAIFGVIGVVTASELDEMGRRLTHRGGTVVWKQIEANVYLGQIAVTAEPPGTHERFTSVIDAGPREDKERVRAALALPDALWHLEQESNCPFAVATWDAQQRLLFLARDYFGIKPLHLCRLPSGGLAFATEYKALLALNEVPVLPDLEAIHHLQMYKAVPPGRTLLKGIATIAPGCLIKLNALGETVETQRMREIGLRVRAMTEEAACTGLRQKLLAATSNLVAGRSRVSVALSGGIDSLSVAAMARHCAPTADLVAFTAGQSDDDPEVQRAAYAIARLEGVHESIVVSNDELTSKLPLAVWHMENPIGRSETFQFFALAKRARERGVDRLLSGMGADLLFGGMPRHKVLWMAEIIPQLRNDLLEFYTATQTGRMPNSLLARCMTRLYYKGNLPEPPAVMNAEREIQPELLADAGPEFLNRCLMLDGQEPTSRTLARIERPLQSFAIEYGSPYLDKSVVDFAFTIPGSLKIRKGTQKYVLRKAMQPLVGDQLCKAPKELMRMKQNSDFAATMSQLADRYLSVDRVRRRGFFDVSYVQGIRRICLGASHPEILMRLWTLIVTEIWAELYLDGRGRCPAPATVLAAHDANWAAMPKPALL